MDLASPAKDIATGVSRISLLTGHVFSESLKVDEPRVNHKAQFPLGSQDTAKHHGVRFTVRLVMGIHNRRKSASSYQYTITASTSGIP
ncbi:uncharacterized protein TrAtP1_001852 [Trichoderma atroviride]|uniref:uncharacterized protein n=1 Tax=Hypocrea atroviridis TaxID=63577 RepID=UPI00332BBDE0|nr:hypothetical protein TrAtP1_001852 [Trichoderma atroviride]